MGEPVDIDRHGTLYSRIDVLSTKNSEGADSEEEYLRSKLFDGRVTLNETVWPF